MAHVFISYKRGSDAFIKKLRQEIEKAGITTWTDKHIKAGQEWQGQIDEAIKGAFALIVVMTPQARKSEYVTYEWSFAMGSGVTIIPIMLEPTDLHPKLTALQYLDFSTPYEEPWDDLIEQLTELVRDYDISGLDDVIERLQDRNADNRNRAIIRLERVTDPTALPILRQILYDVQFKSRLHRKEARKAAVQALGNIGEAALADLKQAVFSRDDDLRFDAAGVLCDLGDMAVDTLVEILESGGARARCSAVWALGTIADERAVPVLIDMLSDQRAVCYRGRRVCDEAVVALERIDTEEAREAVKEWRRNANGAAKPVE